MNVRTKSILVMWTRRVVAAVIAVFVSVGAGYMEYLAIVRYPYYPGSPLFWGVVVGVVVFAMLGVVIYELKQTDWL